MMGIMESVSLPPLLGNLPMSDTPTPRNFRDPPYRGGYGFFLEPHIPTPDVKCINKFRDKSRF